uniref:Uncharacterized protein n=1 Tax=Solanum tuberosum TaxID=4113 RepID=M1DRR6_SOLTU
MSPYTVRQYARESKPEIPSKDSEELRTTRWFVEPHTVLQVCHGNDPVQPYLIVKNHGVLHGPWGFMGRERNHDPITLIVVHTEPYVVDHGAVPRAVVPLMSRGLVCRPDRAPPSPK